MSNQELIWLDELRRACLMTKSPWLRGHEEKCKAMFGGRCNCGFDLAQKVLQQMKYWRKTE